MLVRYITPCFEHVRAGGGCSNRTVCTFIMGHCGGDVYIYRQYPQGRQESRVGSFPEPGRLAGGLLRPLRTTLGVLRTEVFIQ